MIISERFLQKETILIGPPKEIGARPEVATNNICVMKFGGTSVGGAEAIERVAGIVEAYRKTTIPIVVVSAMSGVTNQLDKVFENIFSRNSQAARTIVARLRERHNNICSKLEMPTLWRLELEKEISFLFDQLMAELDGMTDVSLEKKDEKKDRVLSYGERLSAKIVAARVGLLAQAVDASAIIETNDKFGDAVPNMERTKEKAKEAIFSLIQRGIVPIVTGFIGSTSDGRITTLGRNTSDYSAGIVAVSIGAKSVLFFKDVDGIYDSNGRVIPEMTFGDVPKVLGGTKVIDKRALDILGGANIDAWVLNTFDETKRGTRISCSSKRIEEGV